IYTREIIGEALQKYKGTLVLVTHDRYLMNSLACPILYVEDEKVSFFANYEALMARSHPETFVAKKVETAVKPAQNQKEIRRLKAENRTATKEIEALIETTGADIIELENLLQDSEVTCDHIRLQEVCDKLDDAKMQQDDLYAKGEKLLAMAEELGIDDGQE
ncbi:MAG: ABC transporter ATP-binding protein, partial [Oscillospiraceae bacterium]